MSKVLAFPNTACGSTTPGHYDDKGCFLSPECRTPSPHQSNSVIASSMKTQRRMHRTLLDTSLTFMLLLTGCGPESGLFDIVLSIELGLSNLEVKELTVGGTTFSYLER